MCTRLIAFILFALVVMVAPRAKADTSLAVERFGVGSTIRSGGLCGILVRAQTDVAAPTDGEISWELPNGDGDRVEMSRPVIFEPGRPVRAWVYGVVPPARTAVEAQGFVSTLRLWRIENGARVEELGRVRFTPNSAQQPSQAVDSTTDLIGVIGSGRMGLDAYSNIPSGFQVVPSENGELRVVMGIEPEGMPDRWWGLDTFGTLVWTSATPQSLSASQAEAVLSWIGRGGHLVIVLPSAGNPWDLGTAPTHAMGSILPRTGSVRQRAVAVSTFVSTLSLSNHLLNPSASTDLWTFDPSTLDRAFRPLCAMATPHASKSGIAMPAKDTLDGAIWAVRRNWGTGIISILGIDADALSRRALQAGAFPQADVFWNPILGMRCDTPSPQEYASLAATNPRRLVRGDGSAIDVLGDLVDESIGLRGEAVTSILWAFLAFVSYWVVAVLVSYYGLRSRGLERHSWVAYTLVAIVFGAGAWTLSLWSRLSQLRVQHWSVIDQVLQPDHVPTAGEPLPIHIRGWMGAYLPGYNRTRVVLDDAAGGDYIAGWTSPRSTGSGFPDPQTVVQPISSWSSTTVPARATATLLSFDHAGAPPDGWGSLVRVAEGSSVNCEVRAGRSLYAVLSGVIEHSFPAPLEDVHILMMTTVRAMPARLVGNPPVRSPSGVIALRGTMRIRSTWLKDEPLDLGSIIGGVDLGPFESAQNPLSTQIDDAWIKRIRDLSAFDMGQSTMTPSMRIGASTLYSLLTPPRYFIESTDQPEFRSVHCSRSDAHWLDLSDHAMTSCIIIWGTVRGPLPLRLSIDGVTPIADGMTLVRTIIPLNQDADWLAPLATGRAE